MQIKMIRPGDFDIAAGPRVDPRAGPRPPWYLRLVLALQRRKYGAELEASRLWGRLPRSFLLLTLLYRTLDRADSPLEPGLRALVQLRVSQINWCAFCVDLMSASAIERAGNPGADGVGGVSEHDEQVQRRFERSPAGVLHPAGCSEALRSGRVHATGTPEQASWSA